MPPQLVMEQGEAGKHGGVVCTQKQHKSALAGKLVAFAGSRCRQLRVVSPMPWQAYRMPPGWLLAIWTTTQSDENENDDEDGDGDGDEDDII